MFRCYRHTVLCTAVLSFILTLFPGNSATAQERPDTTINHHPITAFDPGWIARYYGLDWNASGADGSAVSASVSDGRLRDGQTAGKAEDADSYTLSLRANLLRWATLTPDLGIEWRISPSVGIMVNGSWTSWTWNDNARRRSFPQAGPFPSREPMPPCGHDLPARDHWGRIGLEIVNDIPSALLSSRPSAVGGGICIKNNNTMHKI